MQEVSGSIPLGSTNFLIQQSQKTPLRKIPPGLPPSDDAARGDTSSFEHTQSPTMVVSKVGPAPGRGHVIISQS